MTAKAKTLSKTPAAHLDVDSQGPSTPQVFHRQKKKTNIWSPTHSTLAPEPCGHSWYSQRLPGSIIAAQVDEQQQVTVASADFPQHPGSKHLASSKPPKRMGASIPHTKDFSNSYDPLFPFVQKGI